MDRILCAEGPVCRHNGSRAPLSRNRDGNREGFGRLESDTTTPLFLVEATGVRANFLHEKKKKVMKLRRFYDLFYHIPK